MYGIIIRNHDICSPKRCLSHVQTEAARSSSREVVASKRRLLKFVQVNGGGRLYIRYIHSIYIYIYIYCVVSHIYHISSHPIIVPIIYHIISHHIMQYVNCLSSTPFFVKHDNRQLTQLSGSRTVSHRRSRPGS